MSELIRKICKVLPETPVQYADSDQLTFPCIYLNHFFNICVCLSYRRSHCSFKNALSPPERGKANKHIIVLKITTKTYIQAILCVIKVWMLPHSGYFVVLTKSGLSYEEMCCNMCRYIGCTIGFILSGEPFQRNFNALHSGVILGTSKSTRRKIWRDYIG